MSTGELICEFPHQCSCEKCEELYAAMNTSRVAKASPPVADDLPPVDVRFFATVATIVEAQAHYVALSRNPIFPRAMQNNYAVVADDLTKALDGVRSAAGSIRRLSGAK